MLKIITYPGVVLIFDILSDKINIKKYKGKNK